VENAEGKGDEPWKKTVVITRSGSCARLSIHATGPTGASVTAEKKTGKTTSNFLILKAVYVLFNRNRTVAIQFGPRKAGGTAILWAEERKKKRN